MKREILFKGKQVGNGEWIKGDVYHGLNGLIYINTVVQIDNKSYCNKQIQVLPETVCQFTGLLDKNGKRIFEGDKINFSCAINGSFIDSVVEYDSIDGAWSINWDKETNRVHYFFNEIEECEIIGNIHD